MTSLVNAANQSSSSDRVHDCEEHVVRERHQRRESQEPHEVHAACGEELIRSRRPRPRVAVDDAAGQEQPQQKIGGAEPQERRGPALAVGKGGEVVEHRGEPDDARPKRAAQRSRLSGELAPPLHVDAARHLVGQHAVAEMRLQRLPHQHGKGKGGQQRDDEDARENDGRLIDAANAVPERVSRPRILPSVLCPLPCHRQMRKAQVSS